jgi:hypothetical protein
MNTAVNIHPSKLKFIHAILSRLLKYAKISVHVSFYRK